jgi:hypothetical protein
MRAQQRETALITGASEGIGRELARVFAERGFGVVLVARNAERLRQLASELAEQCGVPATPIALDLTKPDAPRELFERVRALGLSVDVLANNAGLMEFGEFAACPPDRLASLTALNVCALTALTRLFLEPMLAARHGRILNLGSTGSFVPMPSMAAYAASKAYILSLSEALSEELAGSGVSVTCCCPGFTETHMANQITGVEKLKGVAPLMDPLEVARDAYQACMRGDVLRVPGVANQLLIRVLGVQPRGWVRRLGGAIGRRAMHVPSPHG